MEGITPKIRCARCQEFKPATTEFFPKGGPETRYGFFSYCKACGKKARRPELEFIYPLAVKTCNDCNNTYPATLEYFFSKPNLHTGLSSNCKECGNKRAREYRKSERGKKACASGNAAQAQRYKAQNQNRNLYEDNSRTKVCGDCNRELSVTEFYVNRARPDGLKFECKVCSKLRTEKWSLENPEKAVETAKRAKEKFKSKENKKRIIKLRANKRAEKAYQRIQNWELRSKRYNVISDFNDEDWQHALEYFHHCCAVCGRQMNDMFGEFYPAADHWHPLSKGGHTIPENIVPLCHGIGGCNNKKHDIMPQEWLEREYGKKKAKEILARIEAYFKSLERTDKSA